VSEWFCVNQLQEKGAGDVKIETKQGLTHPPPALREMIIISLQFRVEKFLKSLN
jgi:hypothetical protein